MKVRTKKAYPIEFKILVIDEAKKTSNRSAARMFNLDESSIRFWRSKEVELRQAFDIQSDPAKPSGKNAPRFRLGGGGRKAWPKWFKYIPF